MADTRDPIDGTLHVDVRKRFASGASVTASFDVTLGAHSILVLFGPSGAGKTTLLRILAGLERPDQGRLVFQSESWLDTERGTWVDPQRRRIGYVTQDSTLFPHLSVRDNIAYGVNESQDPDLAALCGVQELLDRRPRELSGGQAQRVALARALARSPRLLLLDEPFASLDLPARSRLRSDLRGLLERLGVPAVLVTHDRHDALTIGDSIAVMVAGRLQQVGTVAQVFGAPTNAEVAMSLGVETVVPAVVERIDDGLLTLSIGAVSLQAVGGETRPEVGGRVFACIRAEDVVLEPPTSHAPTSARNRLPASVTAVAREGPVDRITLDCGFPLVAVVTHQSRQQMHLVPRADVVAIVKATAVHVVPRE